MPDKHPSQMSDEQYVTWINELPSAEERITAVLRESRFVSNWFPPYSSGAGDAIANLLQELRLEWEVQASRK